MHEHARVCADPCSGQQTLTANSGGITDGSGSYAHNAECSWLIQPATRASSVTLRFSSFEMETDYDFVYVYDGVDENAPQIAKLHGEELPSEVTATSGTMFVKMTSDESEANTEQIFSNIRSMPTANAEDPYRSKGA